MGEDETGDNRAAVCGEGNMFRIEIIDPDCFDTGIFVHSGPLIGVHGW